MKKEEILEASRKENKKRDMYEREMDSKAAKLAALAMLILATVYYIYEITKGKGSNPAFYSMITLFNTVMWGYLGIKIEEKRGLRIFTSAIWGILTIMLVFEYFTA